MDSFLMRWVIKVHLYWEKWVWTYDYSLILHVIIICLSQCSPCGCKPGLDKPRKILFLLCFSTTYLLKTCTSLMSNEKFEGLTFAQFVIPRSHVTTYGPRIYDRSKRRLSRLLNEIKNVTTPLGPYLLTNASKSLKHFWMI